MALGGFANRVARIDLTNPHHLPTKASTRKTRASTSARAASASSTCSTTAPRPTPTAPTTCSPSSTGRSPAPEVTMSGRLAFVTKSPLTGTVTDSHMGGWERRPPALGRLRRPADHRQGRLPPSISTARTTRSRFATPLMSGASASTTPSSTSAPAAATPPTSQSWPSARPARTASSSHRS